MDKTTPVKARPALIDAEVEADCAELRDIAEWFDRQGKKPNGDFLRSLAHRHKILAGAYRSSTTRYERELKEWIERERTPEEKAAALKWLIDMRGES